MIRFLQIKFLGFLIIVLIHYCLLHNNDLYDFEKTTKSIKFFKPDFSDLKLDPQPLWLTGGVLNIDFDLIKNLGSIIL